MIEFISYDGKYPNLCRGVLVMKIDGKVVSFHPYLDNGVEYDKEFVDGGKYPSFWGSGGCVRFEPDYSDYEIQREPWEISHMGHLPEEIESRLKDLIEVFNDNVRFGCCGGCV